MGDPNLGLGHTEAMLIPGDSGGGLFIQESGSWWLAAINSYVTRWTTADVDTQANGSIGDIGVATGASFPARAQELIAERTIVDDVTLVGVTQLVERGTG